MVTREAGGDIQDWQYLQRGRKSVLSQDVVLKMVFEYKKELLKLMRKVHSLSLLIIILSGIDFVLIFLPLETNTKTSLETNFQTRPRPRHVLKQNFKQDQYQDWSWFENSVKTETNTWSWLPKSWISRPRPRVSLNSVVSSNFNILSSSFFQTSLFW